MTIYFWSMSIELMNSMLQNFSSVDMPSDKRELDKHFKAKLDDLSEEVAELKKSMIVVIIQAGCALSNTVDKQDEELIWDLKKAYVQLKRKAVRCDMQTLYQVTKWRLARGKLHMEIHREIKNRVHRETIAKYGNAWVAYLKEMGGW
jgi:hypothetical protein